MNKQWFVFALIAVSVFMSTLDGSIVNIALPVIMNDFNVSMTVVGWVVMVYLLVVTALLLSFGRMSDIKGRRYIYVRGMIIFTLGSFFCGMSQNAGWLISARAFQGVGAAMIMACTPAIIVDTFPAADRGRILGLVGSVVALGLTMGPAVGGYIVAHFSWRFIFYINLPIGILSTIGCAVILKGGKADFERQESFDIAGGLLIATCLGTFLTALTHGYDWGFRSPGIILLSAVTVISLILLYFVETKVKYPVLQPSIFTIRLFSLPLLSAIAAFASLFTLVFLMPFYLMNPCGFSVDHAGYIMVSLFIILLVVSPISGAISDRTGSRLLCTAGMGLLTISMYKIAHLSTSATPLYIACHLISAGTGIAIFLPPNSSATISAVPPKRRGSASGTIATARNLGMVLGIALAGAIFNSVFSTVSGGPGLRDYKPEYESIFMDAFRTAMISGAVIAGIGTILAFLRGHEKNIK